VLLTTLEWGFTLLFTVEYLLRLACVRHPWRYATSFYGVIDLLAVAPTYLAILLPELHSLIDVRVLRLLRVFRILKLTEYIAEFGALGGALIASRRKIFIFLSFVLMVVLVMGTLMYVIEGPTNGFTSIPVSVYWAITTMTTVGFTAQRFGVMPTTRTCHKCQSKGHFAQAKFCRDCGAPLPAFQHEAPG